MEACDLDVLPVAGRYTLFDQEAMDELLPLCEERTVSIVVGGVFNSGILIEPSPGARYLKAEGLLRDDAPTPV